MKQRAKTVAANPPAIMPAVMFLRAVSRSTAGFLSLPAVWVAGRRGFAGFAGRAVHTTPGRRRLSWAPHGGPGRL